MGWMERHEQVGEAAATPAGRVVVGRHRLLGTEQLVVLPTADGLARLLPATAEEGGRCTLGEEKIVSRR
jgi:hypothetical protein